MTPVTATQTLRARLARVEALRTTSDPDELIAGLKRGLRDVSNHVVAKAATIAGTRYVTAAVPDLPAAYERLFVDAQNSDVLALGKHAIAQALKELDYREAAPFLRGLEHFEPVWKGEDRAAGLRAAQARALDRPSRRPGSDRAARSRARVGAERRHPKA
jgi:hypothetical protein